VDAVFEGFEFFLLVDWSVLLNYAEWLVMYWDTARILSNDFVVNSGLKQALKDSENMHLDVTAPFRRLLRFRNFPFLLVSIARRESLKKLHLAHTTPATAPSSPEWVRHQFVPAGPPSATRFLMTL